MTVQPKTGERWRFTRTYEGLIERNTGSRSGLALRLAEDRSLINVPTSDPAWSGERLPDPEPLYWAERMYVDRNGTFWLRTQQDWILATNGRNYSHDYPIRPLTLLVPEAKP